MEEELYLIHIYWQCNQCNSNCQGPSISVLIHCCVPGWEVVTVLPKSIHPKLCFQLQLNEYLMPFYKRGCSQIFAIQMLAIVFLLQPLSSGFPAYTVIAKRLFCPLPGTSPVSRDSLWKGERSSVPGEIPLLCREGRTRQLLAGQPASSCCHLPQSVCCSPSLSVGWKEMLHSWSGCQKGRVKEAGWNLIIFMVIALFCYQDTHSPVVYEDWQILNYVTSQAWNVWEYPCQISYYSRFLLHVLTHLLYTQLVFFFFFLEKH